MARKDEDALIDLNEDDSPDDVKAPKKVLTPEFMRRVQNFVFAVFLVALGVLLGYTGNTPPALAETHIQFDRGQVHDYDIDWVSGTISTTTSEEISVYLQEIDAGFLEYYDLASGTYTEDLRWDKTGGAAGAWAVEVHGDAGKEYRGKFYDLLDENIP